MPHTTPSQTVHPGRRPVQAPALVLAGVLLALSGCGGGGSADGGASGAAAEVADASAPSAPSAAALAADVQVAPSYHLAAVLPGAPDGSDRDGSGASARLAPRAVSIPPSLQDLPTRALTWQDIDEAATRKRALATGNGTASPLAAKTTVTYTPAQVRAAYGLPAVPSDLGSLTALQAAQLGAGQTIYVVDAFHDPSAFGELQAFNNLFGLPPCTQKTLAPGASLPLAAPDAGKRTCEFIQVASTGNGIVSATMPRYDAQWATEIAMDVQWAHAIAPLARIVLIEAASAGLDAMTGAIQLANRMGPGVVSMSFAAPEGSYVTGSEAVFKTPGMGYFAATGDNGTAVNWPAVSPSVVAVGGTSLSYSGSGARSETAWSLAGGGVSAYVATPAYQTAMLLRTTVARRSVADVAMNADPNTGQFVAVIPNPLTCSVCQVSWVTAGGTSLSTPQWAALAAVANAVRAQAGKAALGAPHGVLYQALGSSSGYAAAFLDVAQGANGKCGTCAARSGYDGPTGLGTPNGLALVNLLAEGRTVASAPTVADATVNGAYGQPITFTPSVTSSNTCSLAISGGPAGMAVVGSTVTWPNPTTGSFSVKVTAKDTRTGLSGTGTTTVVVAPPPPPIVSSGSLTATVGTALTFGVGASGRYVSRLSLVGAPSGMTLASSGANAAKVTWAKPVAGTHRFSVKAVDTQTGLSALGSYVVAVNPAAAPQVASGRLAGPVGTPLSATVVVVSANPATLSLAGAPVGMAISAAGVLTWAAPVAGSYNVTVQARDGKTGVVGNGVVAVDIGGSGGPAIFSTVLRGVAGKPFSGTVSITGASGGLSGVAFGATHPGVQFQTAAGMATTSLTWAAPVAGSHTVQVSVTDGAGRSAIALLPLVISAK